MHEMPYDYAEFQRRSQQTRRRQRLQRRTFGALACGALALVGGAQWLTRTPIVHGGFTAMSQPLAVPVSAPIVQRGATSTLSRERAALLLAQLPGDPAIVSVASGMAVSQLEDGIALLDDQLNDAQFDGATLLRIHSLHNQRVQLLDSLTRVRYADQLAAAVR